MKLIHYEILDGTRLALFMYSTPPRPLRPAHRIHYLMALLVSQPLGSDLSHAEGRGTEGQGAAVCFVAH